MKNKHALLIAGIMCVLLSPTLWFASGYARDKQCTAEEDGLGECKRLSDGTNNVLGWMFIMAAILAFGSSLGSFICASIGLFFLINPDGREAANGKFASNDRRY